MSYQERRKNNLQYLTYENEFGDHDYFFYNPDRDEYYAARDRDELIQGEMIFGAERKDLPQKVRQYFDGLWIEVE